MFRLLSAATLFLLRLQAAVDLEIFAIRKMIEISAEVHKKQRIEVVIVVLDVHATVGAHGCVAHAGRYYQLVPLVRFYTVRFADQYGAHNDHPSVCKIKETITLLNRTCRILGITQVPPKCTGGGKLSRYAI